MSKGSKSFSKRVGLLLALPVSFGLAGIAVAHPQGGGPANQNGGAHYRGPISAKMQKCRAERHAKMLAKADANSDGTVSREERKAAHEARRAERLAQFDKDSDGTLNEAERESARHARTVRVFEELDANRDAEVSEAEATASCSPMARHFERVDADGSGSVSWSEFETASKALAKHRRGKRHHKRRGHRGRRGGGGPSK